MPPAMAAAAASQAALPAKLTSGPVKTAYSNTSTASSAPMGSLMMPSHFSTAAGRAASFACLSSGMITVGPVTMRTAPKRIATGQTSPAM